VKYKENRRP